MHLFLSSHTTERGGSTKEGESGCGRRPLTRPRLRGSHFLASPAPRGRDPPLGRGGENPAPCPTAGTPGAGMAAASHPGEPPSGSARG